VRVIEIIRETDAAVTVVIEPESGPPLGFRAGQYLTHCFEINGSAVKRAYSLSAAEGKRAAFTVKAIEGGVASAYVTGHLKPGDRYSVVGPSGDFVLDPAATGPLAFLAAGSGITPVMSLIETVLQADPNRALRLVYACRDQAHIIFHQRLEALRQRHPNLEVVYVLSRPEGAWPGERGRLDASRAAKLLGAHEGTSYYLCGPLPLMDAAESGLRAQGVASTRILRERFLAAGHLSAERPTSAQEIVFRRAGRSVSQQPGETILDAGLRAGISLPFSCTVGGCGSCKIQVTEGEFALNEPNCLTDDERAGGYTLACSAYATNRVTVDA
jgi:ferredoxin-NADP reductase